MSTTADELKRLQEEFQATEDYFLHVVFLRFLDGTISEKTLRWFLDESGLTEKFRKAYMNADTSFI